MALSQTSTDLDEQSFQEGIRARRYAPIHTSLQRDFHRCMASMVSHTSKHTAFNSTYTTSSYGDISQT